MDGAVSVVNADIWEHKAPVGTIVAKGRDRQFIVDTFQPQRFAGDCLPVGIKGIFDEYRAREEIDARLGYRQIREGIDCHPEFGAATDGSLIQAALNPEIEGEGYSFDFGFGHGVGSENLEHLIRDDRTSFPVVSVSPDWWQDEDVPESGRNQARDWEHCVVLLDIVENKVQVHDPLVRQLNSGNPQDYIFELPIIRFKRLWRDTDFPHWTLWIEPDTDLYQTRFLRDW